MGEGLQDHPRCLPEWRTSHTRNLWEEATPDNLALWQREGRGPVASNGAEAGGFARTREDLPGLCCIAPTQGMLKPRLRP